MTVPSPADATKPVFPSVDDVRPHEEGGPPARIGFNYQDEVVVGFFIEMLNDPTLLKIHCETHDDVLLVRESSGGRTAEFVQVKGGEIDKLWSVADLCRRDRTKDGPKVGTSIFEASLTRDGHREAALFRLVTLRSVANDLEALTLPRGGVGREPTSSRMTTLKSEIDGRCPGASSKKGNGSAFWIERCHWDVRHSQREIANANCLALLRLARGEARTILASTNEKTR